MNNFENSVQARSEVSILTVAVDNFSKFVTILEIEYLKFLTEYNKAASLRAGYSMSLMVKLDNTNDGFATVDNVNSLRARLARIQAAVVDRQLDENGAKVMNFMKQVSDQLVSYDSPEDSFKAAL